jgi:NADH-quinone oxidoreductase subunit J
VLIYAGAISILLVFALLLTRDFQEGNESNRLRGPGTFLGVLVFLTLTMVFMRSSWGHSDGLLRAVPEGGTTAALADALFNKFVLPFEIAALLLLAGIVGAIVLGKET